MLFGQPMLFADVVCSYAIGLSFMSIKIRSVLQFSF